MFITANTRVGTGGGRELTRRARKLVNEAQGAHYGVENIYNFSQSCHRIEHACGCKVHDLEFRLTCYKSFIPLGVKDSSLRLYICHHERGREVGEMTAYHD
jgi:hypothetical protein